MAELSVFKLISGQGNDRHDERGLGSNVVNLSGNDDLTPDEKSLLNRGLTFVPTPRPETGILAKLIPTDYTCFGKRMKKADFFKD